MDFNDKIKNINRNISEIKAGKLRSAGVLSVRSYKVYARFYSKDFDNYGMIFHYSAQKAVLTITPTQPSATNILTNVAFTGQYPNLAPICYRRYSNGKIQFVIDWTSDHAPWQYQGAWDFTQELVVGSTAPIRIDLSYEENPSPYGR